MRAQQAGQLLAVGGLAQQDPEFRALAWGQVHAALQGPAGVQARAGAPRQAPPRLQGLRFPVRI